MTFSIRPFASGDLEHLVRITVEAFEPVSIDRNLESAFGVIAGRDWKWRKGRHIEEDTVRDAEGTFVAEYNGEIVGYITTWMDRPAGIGMIPNLAVTAAARGQGIGRALIERALQHFRDHGMECARIETLAQNPIGQQLYPAAGFQEVARQIHYCRRL